MTRTISIQTYLPPHLATWVEQEARFAKQSRSQFIGAILTDLFQGQELRAQARQNAAFIQRRLVFLTCAVDGLLSVHPDPKLRMTVHDAYKKQLDKLAQELDL